MKKERSHGVAKDEALMPGRAHVALKSCPETALAALRKMEQLLGGFVASPNPVCAPGEELPLPQGHIHATATSSLLFYTQASENLSHSGVKEAGRDPAFFFRSEILKVIPKSA